MFNCRAAASRRLVVFEARTEYARLEQVSRPTWRNFVSINGQAVAPEDAKISVFDTSFLRGDGVFEVMGLLPNGKIRSLNLHLSRLQTSADAVGCPLPERETLIEWLEAAVSASEAALSTSEPNGCFRLICTKGETTSGVPSTVVISRSSLPKWPEAFSLYPLMAPWHCAGAPGWETPIKWTSYGPNVVSNRKAQTAGFTDALLLSSDRIDKSKFGDVSLEKNCHVLDGPNFAVGWICNNILYAPCNKTLGLLPSITQDLVTKLAETNLQLKVERGVYTLADVLEAEEVFVMSTTRGVIPVSRIGTKELPAEHPRATELAMLLKRYEE
jgi:4-amino-4-deoxychorismate lyase